MKKGSSVLPTILVDFENRRLNVRSTLGSIRLNFGSMLEAIESLNKRPKPVETKSEVSKNCCKLVKR